MAYYEQGTYLCEVVGQGFNKLNSPKQTEYFGLSIKPKVRMLLTGEEEDIVSSEFDRMVRLWINSESNQERTRERLMELGWDGQSWQDLEPDGDCDLTGQEILLVCKHRQVGDRVWDDFDFPAGGKRGFSSDTEIAKRLDRLSGTARRKSKKKAEKAEPVTADVSDDEVPF